MVVQLYSVFDRVAELYGPVAEAVNDGVAWRQFKSAMATQPNTRDFQLLHLGSFDQAKGLLNPLPLPVVVEGGALEIELAEGRG